MSRPAIATALPESRRIETIAPVVKQIALVEPGRRKRWKRLWYSHRYLVHAASEAGLVDWVFPGDRSVEDDDEWPSELDFLEDDLWPENCFGVWIEPRRYEREPRFKPPVSLRRSLAGAVVRASRRSHGTGTWVP